MKISRKKSIFYQGVRIIFKTTSGMWGWRKNTKWEELYKKYWRRWKIGEDRREVKEGIIHRTGNHGDVELKKLTLLQNYITLLTTPGAWWLSVKRSDGWNYCPIIPFLPSDTSSLALSFFLLSSMMPLSQKSRPSEKMDQILSQKLFRSRNQNFGEITRRKKMKKWNTVILYRYYNKKLK